MYGRVVHMTRAQGKGGVGREGAMVVDVVLRFYVPPTAKVIRRREGLW